MRPIWSGMISFGLVNIPVKLYSAINEKELSFNLLHKEDLSPIRFARICKKDGKEIPWGDIVKGYEYEEGDYVVLADEDFKKADLRITKTIDVINFVSEQEITPSYFQKPYFLEPAKGAEKSYALFREALKRSKKVGIAKFVLRDRENIGAVRPQGNVIILEEMRFAKELRSEKELNLPKNEIIQPKEISMAISFIDQLTTHFNPEEYKDTYTQNLEEIIKEKEKGMTPRGKGKIPKPTEIKDLMQVLKASLQQGQAHASLSN